MGEGHQSMWRQVGISELDMETEKRPNKDNNYFDCSGELTMSGNTETL